MVRQKRKAVSSLDTPPAKVPNTQVDSTSESVVTEVSNNMSISDPVFAPGVLDSNPCSDSSLETLFNLDDIKDDLSVMSVDDVNNYVSCYLPLGYGQDSPWSLGNGHERAWLMGNFYSGSETRVIDRTLSIRRWKNPATEINEIHWQRENLNQNGQAQSPSRQKVTYFESAAFVGMIKRILKEIETTPEGQTLPRFKKHPAAARLWNKKLPDFWTPGLAEIIGSETLKVRPYQSKVGVYFICILFPKSYKEGDSLGTNVMMNLPTARQFVQIMEDMMKEIKDEIETRFQNN